MSETENDAENGEPRKNVLTHVLVYKLGQFLRDNELRILRERPTGNTVAAEFAEAENLDRSPGAQTVRKLWVELIGVDWPTSPDTKGPTSHGDLTRRVGTLFGLQRQLEVRQKLIAKAVEEVFVAHAKRLPEGWQAAFAEAEEEEEVGSR